MPKHRGDRDPQRRDDLLHGRATATGRARRPHDGAVDHGDVPGQPALLANGDQRPELEHRHDERDAARTTGTSSTDDGRRRRCGRIFTARLTHHQATSEAANGQVAVPERDREVERRRRAG